MNSLKTIFVILLAMTPNAFSQTPPIETGVSQTLAKWRAAHYSDVRYKLNLTLEKMSPVLKGTIEINVKLKIQNEKANPDAAQIILDWRRIRGKEELSKISNVALNGTPAKYEEINEHLVFRDGVKAGENVVKLDFTSPIATSGAAITRYVDKEDGAEYVYSLFVPSDASTAFPVFDQPDLKARFQLNLGVIQSWKVTSNEKVGKKIKFECFRGQFCPTIYVFEETKPISTYVFAFAAGDFLMFEDNGNSNSENRESNLTPRKVRDEASIKITRPNQTTATPSKIYVRKSQAEKFKQHEQEVFRLNREAVKYLETYFDYKFPFPKYDLVLIPEFPFGGMEHAGATFLREDRVIFPQEPTANDYITRGNLIFHEAAHQWFGNTVTMRWFDDLWLKEGFAEFMAYKTMEKVLPQYNAWKAFYERNKPLAYLTDATRGTTPIYQEIPNLSAAKSAYGNIVYRKAPSFLRQAEFYLGADKFQTAVRAFLKKYEFANAEWTDLVKEFETASGQNLKDWANVWVKQRGMPIIKLNENPLAHGGGFVINQRNIIDEPGLLWGMKFNILSLTANGKIVNTAHLEPVKLKKDSNNPTESFRPVPIILIPQDSKFVFPNYQDYGYGIFLLDERSRDYVLANIQNETDDFLRAMMWGTLWDSVREAELAPQDYVELAIKNIAAERDELTIQTILNRAGTAMNYYLSDAQARALAPRLEAVLIERIENAETVGQRIVFSRAFVNFASTERARAMLKGLLRDDMKIKGLTLKTKDRFDIAARLAVLGDKDAARILDDLARAEKADEAARYAYAARAGFGTAENKTKYFADFVGNKELSESWIEAAFAPFNSTRHADLTLPYLEKALAELPNLKRNRKIFFVNGWLAAFIGGQKSEAALEIVNKFLAGNPNLDRDLRLKILENVDGLERSVKIRAKYAK